MHVVSKWEENPLLNLTRLNVLIIPFYNPCNFSLAMCTVKTITFANISSSMNKWFSLFRFYAQSTAKQVWRKLGINKPQQATNQCLRGIFVGSYFDYLQEDVHRPTKQTIHHRNEHKIGDIKDTSCKTSSLDRKLNGSKNWWANPRYMRFLISKV